MNSRVFASLLGVLVAGGCSSSAPPPIDSGVADAGATDGGATDAGAPDAGATDAGVTDAGRDGGAGGCAAPVRAVPLPATLQLPGEPGAIKVGDVDCDSYLDLVTLVARPASVEPGRVDLVVLWGDDAGTFAARAGVRLPGVMGITPSGTGTSRDSSTDVAEIIDWNGDGKSDVATAAGVALADGARGFVWSPFPQGDEQHFMPATVAALNGAVHVVRGTKGGRIERCSQAGCVPLPGQTSVCPPNTNCEAIDVAVADFDLDGAPDILAGVEPLTPPFLRQAMLWRSSVGFSAPLTFDIDPEDWEIGDLDGDGLPDVVAQLAEYISDFPSQTEVWINADAGTAFTRVQYFGNYDNHNDPAELADVDGDGCLDWSMIGVDIGGAGVYRGVKSGQRCAGTFGPLEHYLGVASLGLQQLDVNGDGTAEWVFRHATDGTLRIMVPTRQ